MRTEREREEFERKRINAIPNLVFEVDTSSCFDERICGN